MTKTIELTKGKVALVDDADYEWLNQYKWCAQYDGYNWYVIRSAKPQIYMHRLIIKTPDGMMTDHVDRDGLNNTRANLRVCSSSQNQQNRKSKCGNSIYKGVCWHRLNKNWMASIRLNGEKIYLGGYDSETAAAKAYNEAALKYFGDFARINEEVCIK